MFNLQTFVTFEAGNGSLKIFRNGVETLKFTFMVTLRCVGCGRHHAFLN